MMRPVPTSRGNLAGSGREYPLAFGALCWTPAARTHDEHV
jgi:hypothetical protein